MKGSIPLLAVVLLACSSAVGCTACQGTNDYCGPLPDEPCDFFYRRNSILGGDLQSHDPEAGQQQPSQQENLPTPAPEQGGETQPSLAPEPMPPEAEMPSDADLPPESADEPPPDGELPPGASLHRRHDPYAYHAARKPKGLFSSFFGRR